LTCTQSWHGVCIDQGEQQRIEHRERQKKEQQHQISGSRPVTGNCADTGPFRKGNIMSALRKIPAVEHVVAVNEAGYRVLPTKPYVAFRAEVARAVPDKLPKAAPVAATAGPTAAAAENHLKNFALFGLAPFIGLAYAALLPFVGLGLLAVLAIKVLAAKPATKAARNFIKNVTLFVAAPFIGLLFVVTLPLIGATMLGRFGAKALMTRATG
jgi:hypothetical protein